MVDVAPKPLRELVDAHCDEIMAIVAGHHGRSVAVFGSLARGDEEPDSDIDFLVELEPDARPLEILSIGVELEEALGVKVDVGTPASLRTRLLRRGSRRGRTALSRQDEPRLHNILDAIDAIRDH